MSNLKFRAWCLETKEYYQAINLDFGNGMVGVIIGTSEYYGNSEEFIIEQYTGLKDVSGVEIYVGDIISLGSLDNTRHRYIIKFYDNIDIGCNGGEYGFEVSGYVPTRLNGSVDSYGDCEYAYQKLLSSEVKVIGNIHENKELIK